MKTGRMERMASWTAGLLYYLLGALWYSPVLFTRPWLALIGKDFNEVRAHGALPYVYALIGALLAAHVVAYVIRLREIHGVLPGIVAGLGLGVGLVCATAIPAYLFEGRPLPLLAINFGYPVLGLAIVGGVIGGARGEGEPG